MNYCRLECIGGRKAELVPRLIAAVDLRNRAAGAIAVGGIGELLVVDGLVEQVACAESQFPVVW